MEPVFIEDKIIDKKNFTQNFLPKGDYEYCKFSQCDFSNSDMAGIKFLACEFIECNLSLAKMQKTAFRDVKFKDCKMLGLLFEHCSEFALSFSFDNCN